MDELAAVVVAGALLGAVIGAVGPAGWRWNLLRLSPLLLLLAPALYVLGTRSWIFGGGGPWVEPSLLAVVGSVGYLPALLAALLVRWLPVLVHRRGLQP